MRIGNVTRSIVTGGKERRKGLIVPPNTPQLLHPIRFNTSHPYLPPLLSIRNSYLIEMVKVRTVALPAGLEYRSPQVPFLPLSLPPLGSPRPPAHPPPLFYCAIIKPRRSSYSAQLHRSHIHVLASSPLRCFIQTTRNNHYRLLLSSRVNLTSTALYTSPRSRKMLPFASLVRYVIGFIVE